MAIALKEYRACKHNEIGVWHFCCVHGDIVYPVGACRENNKKDSINPPCEHKTEEEAYKCYEAWEKGQVETGMIFDEDDVIFPSNRAIFATIKAQKNE